LISLFNQSNIYPSSKPVVPGLLPRGLTLSQAPRGSWKHESWIKMTACAGRGPGAPKYFFFVLLPFRFFKILRLLCPVVTRHAIYASLVSLLVYRHVRLYSGRVRVWPSSLHRAGVVHQISRDSQAVSRKCCCNVSPKIRNCRRFNAEQSPESTDLTKSVVSKSAGRRAIGHANVCLRRLSDDFI
jgi:hypothetical protein